ncbi:hypothetical protein C0J52_01937 [Blattella germanica]|nr:hypothetical protein C0J52_01937 [Blattella germanica]
MVDAAGNTQYSKVFQMALGTAVYKRLKAIQQYNWFSEKKIQSKVILIRTEAQVVPSDDYGLSKICNQKVEVHCIPGNHVTILDSQETANIINEHAKLRSN